MAITTDPKILRRTVATTIDYGIFLGFFVWLITTFGSPNEEGGYTLRGIKGAWAEIFWFIYFPVVESINGQTLGKLILGLKVVTKSGNRISFWQALKRHLVDVLDFFFFGIVAFITIKNTPDHQRVGDLWAKTIVIGGDKFVCTNCREQLTLSAAEIVRQQFVCPNCKSTIRT